MFVCVSISPGTLPCHIPVTSVIVSTRLKRDTGAIGGKVVPGSIFLASLTAFQNTGPALVMATHLLAALLCCASALLVAATSPPVTCVDDAGAAATILAVQHINEHHKHGYKFKLDEAQASNFQQGSDRCHFDLMFKLRQTKCHVSNPKSHEDCDVMSRTDRGALATCNSTVEVVGGVAHVVSHNCDTKAEFTNAEIAMICATCPGLMPLDDETGAKAAQAAVKKYNQQNNHLHYFGLMEISQLQTYYNSSPTGGTFLRLEFALVETVCPKNFRVAQEACEARCPDRAHHAFCKTRYRINGEEVGDLDCELYLPKDITPLADGQIEPACVLFHNSQEDAACHHHVGNQQPEIHQICPFPPAVLHAGHADA
ncbi:alpha-2-HS-glycoprotein-like [Corythoichthys intestinalis]|uniref:alpha-2-HS-glycoprotein-like n=1 Tax=Corythoichthys intestinalis TaxID=161448 RepID=UPI0025A529D3|nr:alpha-2-HS-glycoprotein-like [Corythoichthys intestinalis]